jgi:hypothetical protein
MNFHQARIWVNVSYPYLKSTAPLNDYATYCTVATKRRSNMWVLVMIACGPSPASIELNGLPDAPVEGQSATVTAVVKDKEDNPIEEIDVAWKFEPQDSLQHVGNQLTFSKEGAASIQMTVGDLQVSKDISIGSPLVGVWQRTTQPFKGMEVEFKYLGPKLIGEIKTAPPINDEATQWRVETFFSDVKGYKNICFSGWFGSGLRKWEDINRLDNTIWEVKSLAAQPPKEGIHPDKPCPAPIMDYNKMVVTMASPDTLSLRDQKNIDVNSGTSQTWTRIK